jgi:hypothetical protein
MTSSSVAVSSWRRFLKRSVGTATPSAAMSLPCCMMGAPTQQTPTLNSSSSVAWPRRRMRRSSRSSSSGSVVAQLVGRVGEQDLAVRAGVGVFVASTRDLGHAHHHGSLDRGQHADVVLAPVDEVRGLARALDELVHRAQQLLGDGASAQVRLGEDGRALPEDVATTAGLGEQSLIDQGVDQVIRRGQRQALGDRDLLGRGAARLLGDPQQELGGTGDRLDARPDDGWERVVRCV